METRPQRAEPINNHTLFSRAGTRKLFILTSLQQRVCLTQDQIQAGLSRDTLIEQIQLLALLDPTVMPRAGQLKLPACGLQAVLERLSQRLPVLPETITLLDYADLRMSLLAAEHELAVRRHP